MTQRIFSTDTAAAFPDTTTPPSEFTELCIIIICTAFVLVAELFNSAIEFALDALYRNKKNTLVGMAKDMSAGAVLIATFTSGVIGAILFLTHIYDIVVQGIFWF